MTEYAPQLLAVHYYITASCSTPTGTWSRRIGPSYDTEADAVAAFLGEAVPVNWPEDTPARPINSRRTILWKRDRDDAGRVRRAAIAFNYL